MKVMKSKRKSSLRIRAEISGFRKEMDLIEAAEKVKRQLKRVADGFAGDAYVDKADLMAAAESYAGIRDCNNCENIQAMVKNCSTKLDDLVERAFSAADNLDPESQRIFACHFREHRRKHD